MNENQCILDAIGNMLNQRSAEYDVQQLLAAANPQNWDFSVNRTARDRILKLRAPIFGDHRLMRIFFTVEFGRNIERAAGDHQPID